MGNNLEKKSSGGTLRLTGDPVSSFDPVAVTDLPTEFLLQQSCDRLMTYPDGRATVECSLATEYTVSPDGTTYEFTLREDLHFHDGSCVTASDVVYSLERTAFSPHSEYVSLLTDTAGVRLDSTDEGETLAVTAVDDRTVRIELTSPADALLGVLANTACSIVPEGSAGDCRGDESRYDSFEEGGYSGCGPFVLEEHTPGEQTRLSAFDQYHEGPPRLDGIERIIETDGEVKWDMAMAGTTDYVDMITAKYDPEKVSVDRIDDRGRKHGSYGPLENGETVQYLLVPEASTTYIGFNLGTVPVEIRRALAFTLDQREINETVFNTRNLPAYHITPVPLYPGGSDAYEEHVSKEYPYGRGQRTDAARAAVEDAGYSPSDPFELTLTHYDADAWTRFARYVKRQAAEIGIDIQLEAAAFGELRERGERGELDAYTFGWIADRPTLAGMLRVLSPDDSRLSLESPRTFFDWSAETGSAADRARTATATLTNPHADETAHRDAAVALEEANWTDVGAIPIFHGAMERFLRQGAEVPPPGVLGGARQQHTETSIDR